MFGLRLSREGLFCKGLKQIHPSHQPNRILTHKPPDFRVVIPETVVVQPAFFVVILTLEAERDIDFEVV